MDSIFTPRYGVAAIAGFCIALASYAMPVVSKSGCAQGVQERLFFGLGGREGAISDAEWESFIERSITPRFPNGLTIVQASGQWQARDRGVVREPSRVVEIVHDGSGQTSQRIAQVAAEYKALFRQESVLITRARVDACF